MQKPELQTLLTSDYRLDNWKKLLLGVFHARGAEVRFDKNPAEVITTTKAAEYLTRRLSRLGEIQLSDGKIIALFEAEVQNTRIAKNRVGLRGLIQHEIIPGFQDAALAIFYSPDQPEWRLTFISKYEFPAEVGGKTVRHETHPKKFTYVLGETESCKTARDRLFDLSLKELKTLPGVTDAFSVGKLSAEFFAEYKEHYKIFYDFLKVSPFAQSVFGIRSKDEKDFKPIRDFVKKLLGRIVFLYFLQKKGWMGVLENEPDWSKGDKQFMAKLFEKSDKSKDFFSNYLVPLFFGTLNTRRDEQNHLCILDGLHFGKVPYLNGGLFEKDFERVAEIQFHQNGEETLFRNLFRFFESYNFTIAEDSPDEREVAVDPEMLGHIFENLIEDNKDKGTFYTPKEVVHFMTQEALFLYLQQHLILDEPEQASLRRFVQYREMDDAVKKLAGRIDQLLDAVKICDPAIGSGAFPMGLLLEIYHCKLKIYAETNPGHDFKPAEVKEGIIRNSIYGVDIDKGAIDTARLRFWLSLIVDIDQPRQLPHLDYKFMQGDSLRETFEGIDLSKLTEKTDDDKPNVKPGQGSLFDAAVQTEIRFGKKEQDDIEKLTRKFFQPIDEEVKQKIQAQIAQKVDDAINETLRKDKQKLLLNKAELNLEAHRQSEIKGAVPPKLTKKIDSLEKEIQGFEEKQERLYNSRGLYEKPYFLWHLWFAHIFKDGGFDIVIANPPYKRDNAYDDVKDLMQLGSTDLYGMFTALAIDKLLKPGGSLVFITSDTWLTITTHKELRQKILARQLQKVLRLPPDTFGATVNTCVFALTNTPQPSPGLIAADLTNISRQKETPDFREKLWHLEKHIGEATNRYAVYQYPQNLIFTNSNLPVFTASPHLFRLMNDTACPQVEREIGEGEAKMKVQVRQVDFNGHTVELVRFGDVAEVKVGLQTGDNHYYLYQNPEARGNYKDINLFRQYLLTEKDLGFIRNNEAVRLAVIEHGIHKSREEKGFDERRWFGGRYIAPYDKGGESDTDEGWLPNYYVPTDYFIDWSAEAVGRLKNYKIVDRIRDRQEKKPVKQTYFTTNAAVIRSPELYFKWGISFSRTGIYSPTFRLNAGTPFDTEGSSIFSDIYGVRPLLALLGSKLSRYILKNKIGHTVHTQVEEVKELVLPIGLQSEFDTIVNIIITKQKIDSRYNFFENEQKQIDTLIYQLYSLSEADIQEVETWWARRYPKLARYADTRFMLTEGLLRQQEEFEKRLRDALAQGENKYVEFKQSLRPGAGTASRFTGVKHNILKSIAAFLNTEGGTLLIGVAPDNTIAGLEAHDYTTFSETDKADAWRKHFDNTIQTYFGNHLQPLIGLDIVKVEGSSVAIVHIKNRAPQPVWLKNRDDHDREELYIRRSASTVKLEGPEAVGYVRQVWR